MHGWAGKRLGKYETLKRLAEEQNQVKEDINRKITGHRSGDLVLTKEEYRTMGLAWANKRRGNVLTRLLHIGG
jgi:hypothetical protein